MQVRNFFSLIVLVAYVSFSDAQNALVKMWDYRFGGTYPDELAAFQQTRDGGYILAGYSNSGVSGDKTQPTFGTYDYWIVKINRFGVKEWDADFGGTDVDYLTCICQTNDGGYLLGGYSCSNAGGCKTQNNWDASGMTTDFWVVRTDSLGVKLWDRDYGGLDHDNPTAIIETTDHGFLIGGFSNSPAGGDKTQNSIGSYDFWALKADATGNKLWDKDFGGNSIDEIRTIRQTADHGFVLGGLSNSGISGDKTQPTFGIYDFWLIKTDSLGNFEWDKDYGGSQNDYLWSMEIMRDHGLIMAGISESNASGNKTSNLWGGNGTDYWAVRTDSIGNIQWQRNLGGINYEDEFGNLSVGSDGGIVFGGTSYSNISGDKTENNLGTEQGWFVKIDSIGQTVLDKTIALNSHDENGHVIQTREGCYVFAQFNGAPVGGLKSQAPQGVDDYWIVRFCDSTLIPVSAIAFVNPICPGTCTDFLNLSINANSYLWLFPGANPSISSDANPTGICYNAPGQYDVTLIAMSAIGNDTLTLNNFVNVYPYPPPQGIAQWGDTLFAISGAVTYQWYFNNSIIPGATNYYYVTALNGDYNVVATDSNGCEVEAVIYNVMKDGSQDPCSNIVIYPNPINDWLNLLIPCSAVAESYQIKDVVGNTVSAGDIDNIHDQRINVQRLQSGMYFMRLFSKEKILNYDFIKE